MIEELTEKVSVAVKKHQPFGFNVRFDVGDDQNIYVYGKNEPITVTNDSNSADTVFKVSSNDLSSMVEGDMSPMSAYITGKMKIEGDMGKAMQLSSIFG
jgi:putative sterol carrier protein